VAPARDIPGNAFHAAGILSRTPRAVVIWNPVTLDSGTSLCAGYQSLSAPGPTIQPAARTRWPLFVTTQNLHDVHCRNPDARTDMCVPPELLLP